MMNQNKQNKIIQIGFIVIFVTFLAAANLFTCSPKQLNLTYSYFENRSLAARPVRTVHSLLDGSFFSGLEKYLTDHAAWRTELIRLQTRLDLLLGRPVIHGVVVQDEILLPWNTYESVKEDSVARAAEQIAENLQSVHDLVTSYGGAYCYVAVPCQYAYHASKYPAYLNDRSKYTELSLQYLRDALDKKGVSFLDMGERFDRLGHPDRFSSTVDNHYSMYGAYETYLAILEHFNQSVKNREPLNILTRDEFSFEELDKPYLGSRVRKLLYTRILDEHLFYILLKHPVPFTRTDNGTQTDASVFAFPSGTAEWVTYGLYMGGDIGNTVIDTDRDELPSILIYGDSFTNAVECILYWSFDEMHTLDLRYYNGTLSLREYIETYQPDYVVCVRDYEALLLETGNGIGVD